MAFKVEIEKNSDNPIYRQIIEQITRMVKSGTLKSGDKIPPERELAEQLDIARGTIKKAYEELEQDKIIEVTQGRGSFISKGQDILQEGRKEKAIKLIEELLANLESLKFSYREIGNLIHLLMMEREKKLENFHIAAVDCNPEALSIFEKQLRYLSRVKIYKFLLDDIHTLQEPEKKFSEFSIILATSTHYSELIGLLPNLKDKIIQAAVSPSQQTIIDLSAIPSNANIGIICKSKKFLQIIKEKLESFQINPEKINHILEDNITDLNSFLVDKSILIVSPDTPIETAKEFVYSAQQFKERGGKIIKFEYQLERGSLIHIEEQISKKLSAE